MKLRINVRGTIFPLGLAWALAVLVISAPAFGITAISPTDPSLQGTTLATQTFTIDSLNSADSPPVPVFFLDEKIVQNTTGTLDFYFKLRNASDPQNLLEFSLFYPNSVEASTFYLDEGNLAPISAGFSSLGAGYGFGDPQGIVGPLLGSGGTDTLLLRTNAITFTTGGTVEASRSAIDDFGIQPGVGLVPALNSVPEPAALALLPLSLVGLTIKLRRPTPTSSTSP
jgi:hypothetical protein